MSGLVFNVPGVPAPQGSKRYLGNGVLVESSKRVKPWRTDIRQAAEKALEGNDIDWRNRPLELHITFDLPRPKSHYRTGQHADELRPNAPEYHCGRPDVDKLIRAVMDALTGLVWADDAVVSVIRASKNYHDPPGITVVIGTLP